MLITLLTIFGIMIFVSWFIYIIIMDTNFVSIDFWSSKEIRKLPSIKYKDFIKYYSINRQSWNLKDNYISKHTRNGDELFFKFNFIDWYRYKIFLLSSKNNYKKVYILLLEDVQKDIDALRKQSNQEIKEASDKIIEITKRLKG